VVYPPQNLIKGDVLPYHDNVFDSCSKDMGSNPAEVGHCVTTVGKLFTPSVPSGVKGRLNQVTFGIAGSSVATPGKSYPCVGSGVLSIYRQCCSG